MGKGVEYAHLFSDSKTKNIKKRFGKYLIWNNIIILKNIEISNLT